MPGFPNIALKQIEQRQRISQRDILPTAIKGRSLSGFIFVSDVGTASTAMGNGDPAYITFTLTQDKEFEIFGENYISTYVRNITTANLLPGGSGVDESQWQVIGPFSSDHAWNADSFPRHIET